jgi:hypothetical protein
MADLVKRQAAVGYGYRRQLSQKLGVAIAESYGCGMRFETR